MFIIAGLYLATPLLILGLRRWGRAFAWIGRATASIKRAVGWTAGLASGLDLGALAFASFLAGSFFANRTNDISDFNNLNWVQPDSGFI